MQEDATAQTSALVRFTASNVRSYRDTVTLSLQATRLANAEVVRELPTASAAPERLLPVAGVFGGNASGKSNILRAMADMRATVLYSFVNRARGASSFRRPFLLDAQAPERPSEFLVELVLNGVWWQYGFEVDDRRVLREFAYHYPRGRQALVFERDADEVSFGGAFRSAGGSLRPLVRENTLLLSIYGAVDDGQIGPLFNWWLPNFRMAASYNRPGRAAYTAGLAKEDATRRRILDLLRAADLGLTDMQVVRPDAETLDRLRRAAKILQGDEEEGDEFVIEDLVQLIHRSADGEVMFEAGDESMGTQVWVGLAGPVLDALDTGCTLLVDELDASLHPLLVAKLIDLFQSPTTNPRCAQLIFNAHDVNVLDNRHLYRLGRDQLWFTERGHDGATRFYSLADFRARRDESIGRRYLSGRYGAVPDLNPVDFDLAVLGREAEA
ncbi:MAG: ATP-binding protein [Gammaproteobacteria bacterium]|nr:ATP-binding protein [Gammaproteobacteria bacterium]MXW49695.1 ATP-binding protein [Gammaproteobacteria bacterium]MYE53487.1 ATP-binding protein [Gammaproteobacteria bacterium]MYF12172.1 ATP-binding protein [Gammaproteobacteria bacterium]MYF48914.1 ATP-binding protein [Gammaproteobacteria bacterium]